MIADDSTIKVAIIGAGAAGCFCAANLSRMLPQCDITIFERARRPMAKLAITGGGRCNLTNTFAEITSLSQAYPRGWRLMERLFRQFSPMDTRKWWEEAGVPLVVQPDQCIFPRSQDAMQVVNTLLRLMREANVKILTSTKIETLPQGFDIIVITTGGNPRIESLSYLSELDLSLEPPVPSLFALNVYDPNLQALTGIVVEDCLVSIAGTKFEAQGPLLITHFGMSGPAILRLSSYAARYLAEEDYSVKLIVNWMQGENEEQVQSELLEYLQSTKQTGNHHPRHITARHWLYLLERASIPNDKPWNALNKKDVNRLVNVLTADVYQTEGRRQYKAEFVTCGGISLRSINPNTLALKSHPNIYLAGEVLDVDAITGGFNLQAAWTMGYVVAKSIAKSQAI
ncbi:MAG: aminoacetone oxidase family FAD-binding enzyme [Bacteroidaceae bacterium]|nr:aminoacetone oxidase family FAD-binding enzyme [Bacteroidaceae bacterium]